MLMENKKLQHLSIASNTIKDNGVEYVTEGLQHNSTLTVLWLSSCGISERGNYCMYS